MRESERGEGGSGGERKGNEGGLDGRAREVWVRGSVSGEREGGGGERKGNEGELEGRGREVGVRGGVMREG